MRVRFFSKGDEQTTSSRYRCYLFAEELARQGIETAICTPPPARCGLRIGPRALRELARLARELRRVRREDVLYLQRPIHNTPFAWMVKLDRLLRRRRTVFDFCDPIFLHAPRKTRALVGAADLVIASCEDLALWARRHHPNVHVVPNSVPPELVRMGSGSGEPRPVVGWIGSARLHRDNLRLLLPVLERLGADCTFRLVGARGASELVRELEAVPGLRLEVVEWLEPDEVTAAIDRFDIAVLPLVDRAWNRKLVTKLIEYMAAGRAVVASPVGENRLAIHDGVNGFLAADASEWVEKLELLAGDAELRGRLGAAALETVRQRYALDVNGGRLAGLLRSHCG